MDDLLSDERFAHVGRDPRYRDMQKWQRKVKLDKRFKGMFSERRFKLKYLVDKRGRPMRTSTSEHLRRYYEVSISDESDEENAPTKGDTIPTEDEKSGETPAVDGKREKSTPKGKKTKPDRRGASVPALRKHVDEEQAAEMTPTEDVVTKKLSPERDVAQTSSEEDEDTSEAFKGPEVDYSRGIGVEESSDEDSDSDIEDDGFDHKWAELDNDAPAAETVTRRLALCNMDWDRIKVVDLYMLFSSFTPTGGSIVSVKIYPSEYGIEKMKEEEIHGPAELTETILPEGTNEKETTEGTAYHHEKLRQYQLNRLKYYYAVIECDSPQTSSAVYDNCDGTEYENSASKIDLRYIPDEMTFDQTPKSETSSRPDVQLYEPSSFVTSALQQSSVELTWDELDKDRMETMTKVFKKDELESMDIADYLASESDGSGDEDPYAGFLVEPTFGKPSESKEKKSNKYAELLKDLRETNGPEEPAGKGEEKEEKKDDVEMEISWEPGLTEKAVELTKRRRRSSTPWENYLEKRKEKRARKREDDQQERERKKSAVAPEEAAAAFSDDDLPEGIDMDSEYFREEAPPLPPTDGNTKKKKKSKRKANSAASEEDPKQAAELSLLMMGEEEDDRRHFSLRQIQQDESTSGQKKKKRNKRKQLDSTVNIADDFTIDVQDSRFKAIFDNPLYNIDPSVPEFKKTKALTSLLEEKLRRCEKTGRRPDGTSSAATQPAAKKAKIGPTADSGPSVLASLVKSVKAKTRLLQSKKKKKK